MFIMNVLSLFDGMSCGMLALQRVGIKVDNYFASEIDKYAIKISEKNFPEIRNIGDITRVTFIEGDLMWPGRGWGAGKIDLLIGGSPCQGFSFAGKQLNFEDPRSKLFFEYVRILKEVKPKYFLLENVKMKKEYQDIISEHLGVQPIEINSALVSAQNRKRLYWTNIPGVIQPEDKGILLKDILEEGSVDRMKSYCIDANYSKGGNMKRYTEKSSRQIVFGNVNPSGHGMNGNVYDPDGKSPTITTNKGEGPKILACAQRGRYNEKGEVEQKIEIGGEKGNCLTSVQKDSMIVQRSHGFNKGGEHKEKSPTMTSHSRQENNHVSDGVMIRKLTPIECERLQTLPDNYTEGVSNSQRYKMIGNGRTVDVLAHIFSFLS